MIWMQLLRMQVELEKMRRATQALKTIISITTTRNTIITIITVLTLGTTTPAKMMRMGLARFHSDVHQYEDCVLSLSCDEMMMNGMLFTQYCLIVFRMKSLSIIINNKTTRIWFESQHRILLQLASTQ
jgi:hypothetical protein